MLLDSYSGREVPRDGAENHERKSSEFEFVKLWLTIILNLLNSMNSAPMNYICMIFDKLSIQFS